MARYAADPLKKYKYRQSTAVINDPKERAMRDENIAARKHYDNEGLKALACAVSLKAVEDYKQTTYKMPPIGKRKEPRIGSTEWECLIFFNSPLFKEATGCEDSKRMIRLIDEAPLEQITNAMRVQLGGYSYKEGGVKHEA